MSLPRRIGLTVTSAAVSVFLAAGCAGDVSLPGDGPSSSHSGSSSKKGDAGIARKELAGLREAAPGSMSGYSRDRFGPAWKDVDHNGCDTRNDILARDLVHVKKRNTCVVVAGDLDDPYTGRTVVFAKARAFQVQIDHIVPLGLAWQMGADRWTEEKRARLANDRDNLLAVSARPNEQKSDKGPAEWQPRRAYWCTYAEKFIAVADEYHLAVTDADHRELGDMLDTC